LKEEICENKLLTEDSGIKALQRLGLNYQHETFGERDAVEGFFSRRGQRGSGIFSGVLLILCRV